MLEVSAIMSAFVCGIMLSHYNHYNMAKDAAGAFAICSHAVAEVLHLSTPLPLLLPLQPVPRVWGALLPLLLIWFPSNVPHLSLSLLPLVLDVTQLQFHPSLPLAPSDSPAIRPSEWIVAGHGGDHVLLHWCDSVGWRHHQGSDFRYSIHVLRIACHDAV